MSLVATAAAAQVTPFNPEANLVAPHNIAVLDRPQVGYEPLGLRLGVFSGRPTLALGTGFTSNEKAAEIDPRSDAFFTISPRINLSSGWSVHSLALFAGLTQTVFARATEDNSTEYSLGLDGRYDISRAMDVRVGLQRQRRVQPRTDPDVPVNVPGPVEYNEDTFQILGEVRLSQINFSGSASVIKLDYGVVGGDTGPRYDFSFRNGTITTFTGTAGHPLGALAGVYGQVVFAQRRFDQQTEATDRDTDQTAGLIGAVLDLPQLLRGDVAVGYEKFDYQGVFAGISSSGLRLQGSLSYFPTQITTVTVSGSRSNTASGLISSPGRETTAFSGNVDHELLRNVRLNARLGYRQDAYDGIDRDDTIVDAAVGADYAVNRRVSVRLGYGYLNVTSNGLNRVRSFDESRVNLALTLHY